MNSRELQKSLMFIMIGIWIVAGCSSPTVAPVPTSTVERIGQTPSPSPALPERTATSSSTPTLTATRTNTPSPSKTVTATITPTQIPPVPTEKQEEFLKGLLKDNGGCKLPCWWGISPGQTTWREAGTFFRFLGEIWHEHATQSDIHGEGVSFQYLKKPGWLSDLQLQLIEKDGFVDTIEITANNYSLPDEFHSMWSEFSPEKLIQTYGKPSQIWIHTTSYMRKNPTGKHSYLLWMFYDELGFFIRYSGHIQFQPTYLLCPTYGTGDLYANITIYTQSSENETSLLEVSQLMRYKPEVLTIEEATGLTLDDFGALFTQTSKPYCFETPRDVWP